jgi:hypothetical protein
MACAALLEWMSEFRAYLIIPSIGAGGHTSRLVYAFRRQAELHDGGGEDMQVIKSLFARREQRDRVRRSNRGRRDKTLRGEVCGGFRARYGLRFVKGRNRNGREVSIGYEVDQERMATVRRVFESIADGGSLKGLRRELEQEGVPNPPAARAGPQLRSRGSCKTTCSDRSP